MSLNDSIIEDGVLEWFGELGDARGHLNVSISEGAWATDKESLSLPESDERKFNS